MSEGISFRVNARYVLVEKAVSSLVGIALIPFIIRHIGLSEYGSWVAITSLSTYLVLAQLGFSSSFEKYIAEFKAGDAYARLASLVCTAFYVLLILTVLLLILTYAARTAIPGFVLKGAEKGGGAVHLFFPFVGAAAIVFVGQIFRAVPKGFQRFDVSSGIGVFSRLIYAASVAGWLWRGAGLTGILYATFLSATCTLVCDLAATIYFIRKNVFHPKYFDWRMARMLYAFGIKIHASFTALWISQHFDKLLLSSVLGVRYVAFYDVGARLVYFFRDIPMLLFGVIIPKASEMHARGEEAEIRQLYRTGTCMMSVASGLSLSVLFPLCPAILEFWLGRPPDPLSIFAFRVLAVGALIHIVSGVGSSVAKGISRPGFEAVANVMMAGTNIVCSCVFIRLWGFQGVLFGTLLAFLAGPTAFFAMLNRYLGRTNMLFLRETFLLPAILTTSAILFGLVVDPIDLLCPATCGRFGLGILVLGVSTGTLLVQAGILLVLRHPGFQGLIEFALPGRRRRGGR